MQAPQLTCQYYSGRAPTYYGDNELGTLGCTFVETFTAKLVGTGGYLDDFELLSSYLQCAYVDPSEVQQMDKVAEWLKAMAANGQLGGAAAQATQQ